MQQRLCFLHNFCYPKSHKKEKKWVLGFEKV